MGSCKSGGKGDSASVSFVPKNTDDITTKLSDKTLLLSRNTITIKNENGKTAGIVRDISRIDINNPRDQRLMHDIQRQTGVDVRDYGVQNLYKKDGNLYFMNDTSHDTHKVKLKNVVPDEYNEFVEKKKKLRELENAGMYIINYKKQ